MSHFAGFVGDVPCVFPQLHFLHTPEVINVQLALPEPKGPWGMAAKAQPELQLGLVGTDRQLLPVAPGKCLQESLGAPQRKPASLYLKI